MFFYQLLTSAFPKSPETEKEDVLALSETILQLKKKRRAYKLAKRTEKPNHLKRYRAVS